MSAPTTAMQPEWLTSTVTALARLLAEPSSHSTCNFTREMMRLWLRSRAQRSSTLSLLGAFARFIAIRNLSSESLALREGDFTVAPSLGPVNSTFPQRRESFELEHLAR